MKGTETYRLEWNRALHISWYGGPKKNKRIDERKGKQSGRDGDV